MGLTLILKAHNIIIHSLYIWFDHYAHKDASWRLFDHKSGKLFSCSGRLFLLTFFIFLLLFVTFLLLVTCVNYFLLLKVHCLLLFLFFVTFVNYFLLLKGARGIVLLYLFIVQGEGVRLDFFFKFLLLLNGRGGGVQVNVFFSSFIWHVEGKGFKGLVFFLKLFFHCWVGREGGSWVFFSIYVKRGWEGEGVDFLLQIHYWGFGWKYPFSK
jgi:hypothetical protein